LRAGRIQIEVSQWAADHAENPDVRAFAVAEAKEHQNLKKQLAALGFRPPAATAEARPPAAGGLKPGVDFAPGAPRDPTAPPGTPAPPPAGAPVPARPVAVGAAVLGPGASGLITLEEAIGSEYVRLAEHALAARKGFAFDMAYVGQQIDQHLGFQARILVAKRHASDNLRPLLNEAQPVVERHLRTLDDLLARLNKVRTGT
jgi:predicted outer membrane protein